MKTITKKRWNIIADNLNEWRMNILNAEQITEMLKKSFVFYTNVDTMPTRGSQEWRFDFELKKIMTFASGQNWQDQQPEFHTIEYASEKIAEICKSHYTLISVN